MKKLFTLCLLVFSLSASAQWQQTGSKVRYVNGLGIPTKDTAAGVLADSSQILIRPADSSLYIKYKRTWVKVGSGGTIGGSGTTNYIPKFTASTTLGNSQIFDNGTNVGIGTVDLGASGLSFSNVFNLSFSEGSGASNANIFRQRNTVATVIGHSLKRSSTANFASSFTGNVAKAAIAVGFDNGSISFFSDPASNVANGTDFTATERMRITSGGNALIGTTTDNGVDRLQVSGSGYFSGSGVIGKFDGTSTNNAYIDFRTSGTPKWQLGNNASTSHSFNLFNNATSVNSMVVNSSNQIGFNMEGAFITNGGTSAYEHHMKTAQHIHKYFAWDADGLGVAFQSFSSRSDTWGTWTATQSGDPLFQWQVRGAKSGSDEYGGVFVYEQTGATSTRVPGQWRICASNSTVADIAQVIVNGNNDRISFQTNSTEKMRVTSSGRVLMGATLPSDNNVDGLQVNGSIQGTGFDQAYLARTTAYTATDTDYLIDCTTGTFTVTLPASSGRTGRILIIKNSGTGTITVDGNASETIDGATTYSLSAQWATVQLMSDGTNWKIISKF